MSAAFPDLPKGSPDGIRSAARSLREAAREIDSAQGSLGFANETLSGSWEGAAAQAYHSSAQALARVARGAAETFDEYAQTVSGYASNLDEAQSAMRRLKALYDDAIHRAATAATAQTQLSSSLAGASKSAQAGIKTQIGTAETNATNASNDADHYAQAAQDVLTEFKAQASISSAALSADPLGPMAQYALGGMLGQAGPDFGIPSDTGLSPYNGVLSVTVPQPHGPGGILGDIETGGSIVALIGGGCEALFFWVPGVDVGCGGASFLGSEASTLAAWGEVVQGHGSVGEALLDTGSLGLSGAGMGLQGAGKALSGGGSVLGLSGKAAGPALHAAGAQVGGGLSGILSGAGLVPKKDH